MSADPRDRATGAAVTAARTGSGADRGAGGAPGADDPADLADRVRSAVLSVPGVADLSGGIAGEIATYLPGRRVPGVRLSDGGAEVHVVVEPDAEIPHLAAAVQSAVRRVGPRRVDVHVDDLREPQHTSPTSTPTSNASP